LQKQQFETIGLMIANNISSYFTLPKNEVVDDSLWSRLLNKHLPRKSINLLLLILARFEQEMNNYL